MAISPQTELYLLKCPLTLSNKNQLTFNNKQEQFEYFSSLPKLEIERISYQRKNGIISYPAHIDSLLEYNYCMYKNSNYSDKWFYAFITGMTYENDNCTYISIATDVFQTWQFDIQFKESFVEREMINVNDDIPGSNLIPEGLETGEFQIDGSTDIEELKQYYVVAFTGDKIGNKTISQDGFTYNGISSSVTYIFCNSEGGLQVLLQQINLDGNGDKILTAFSIPKVALLSKIQELEPEPTVHYYYYEVMDYNYSQNPVTKNIGNKPSSINGYIPRNKKLLTYPFCYLGFNPPNGTSKIFRYEDFSGNIPQFKVISEINPNPTVCFIPLNYRGKSNENLSDSVSLNGYPNISYKNDVYNTWLAQNSEILKISMKQEEFNYEMNAIKTGIGGASSIIGNSLTGNAMGGISAGANLGLELASLDKNHEFYVQQQMAQIEKQSMLPDSASLSSSNATLMGYEELHKNIFTKYTIKRQFAERIDKYFDMYGYLTNTRKIPNLKNRPNWNYIKTQGANILGNIPQTDLYEIKEFFNNGITLWHNTSNFLDYSVNNR